MRLVVVQTAKKSKPRSSAQPVDAETFLQTLGAQAGRRGRTISLQPLGGLLQLGPAGPGSTARRPELRNNAALGADGSGNRSRTLRNWWDAACAAPAARPRIAGSPPARKFEPDHKQRVTGPVHLLAALNLPQVLDGRDVLRSPLRYAACACSDSHPRPLGRKSRAWSRNTDSSM